jgi:glycosyltransferase involved in cell wall biosynthesis
VSTPVRELSVFLPAFDEEECLSRTVERALGVLRALPLDRFEVVIVDDGSRDRTPVLADRLAAAEAEVRVEHHARNGGYGAALRTGFAASKFAWVFFTDGDGQFDMGELAGFLARAEEYDVVIGYRLERADHMGRRLNTMLWGLAIRVLFRLRVRDVDCAFKLLSRDVLDRVGPLSSTGAVISTELLAKVRRAGIPIDQVGVHHYPRMGGSPSGASIGVIARALRELVQLRIEMWRSAR